MSDALDQIRERMDQNRRAREEALTASARASLAANVLRGGTFFAGDRVFDTIAGLEGIVESSPALAGASSALVAVRVTDGRVLLRAPDVLIARPSPPAR
jgi:hypothetical protein